MEKFASWGDVLVHVRKVGHVLYKAPMSARPMRVAAYVQGNEVKVIPDRCTETDPFYADIGHFDRFGH